MEQSEKLRWLWAIGRFPQAVVATGVPSFVPFLWVDKLGLSPLSASTAWVVQSLAGGVSGPIWGHIVDNNTTKYGRYLPFQLLLCFLFVIVSFALWDPPSFVLANESLMFPYYAFFCAAHSSMCTLALLIVNSSNFELFSPKQHSANSGLLQLFLVVGLIVAQFPPSIAGMDWSNRRSVAVTFGALCFFAQFLAMIGVYSAWVKHQESSEKKEIAPTEKKSLATVFRSMWGCMQNRNIARVIIGNAICIFGLSHISLNTALLTKYVYQLQKDETHLGFTISPPAQAVILGAEVVVLGLPVIPSLIQYTNQHGINHIWWRGSWGMLVVTILAVSLTPSTYFSNFLIAFFVHFFMGLVAIPPLLLLPEMTLGKIIQQESIRDPKNFPGRGVVLGANSFLVHLTLALCGAFQNLVLTVTGYVQPTKEVPNPAQNYSVQLGIQLLVYFLPFVCTLIAAFIMPAVQDVIVVQKIEKIELEVKKLKKKKKKKKKKKIE